jgi:hypothetical protein
MKSRDCLDVSAILSLKKILCFLGFILLTVHSRTDLTFSYEDDIHVLHLGGKNACHKAS